MTYSELLKKLEKDGMMVYRLVAQAEAEFFFNVNVMGQETVDRIAAYIYDWTCSSSAAAEEVARMLAGELSRGCIKLDNVLDYDEETEEHLNDVIGSYCD